MKTSRFPSRLFAVATLLFAACFGDKVVAPDEPLPPELAVDRPRVQLFRYAMGRSVISDTVRITNNGEGPLGQVRQVGGVDYLTTTRVGWLRTEVVNVEADEALLVLWPTYAEEQQAQDDVAEITLKGAGSSGLRVVTVSARTLAGARFEFSVSPLAFAAAPGDPPSSQRITVRNGGNGTLSIHPPTVEYEGGAAGWLSVVPSGGTGTAPEFEIIADPAVLTGGGLFSAELRFSSPENEATRAKAAALEVQLNIGRPELGISASSLGFTVVRGGADPAPQQISISNLGAGPFGALGALAVGQVTYGPQANGWLESALLGTGAIQLSVSTAGLAAGSYGATFSVGSENGGSKPIQVTLSVEAPVLTPSSRSISFGLVEGAGTLPPPDTVRVTNTGSGPPIALGNVTLGSLNPPAPWLTANLSGDRIILAPTPAATSLTQGRHTTTLPIESDFGGSSWVDVVLSVSRGLDQPALSLSATEIEFNGVRGDPPPPPQSVLASNSGGGTLGPVSVGTIGYAGNPGWLSVSLIDSVLTLVAEPGTLPPGSHVATLQVNSVSGGSGTVKVTFTLGSPVLTASTASASFSAPVGGPAPPPKAITLSNTGPGTFGSLGVLTVGSVSYTGSPGWLSASLAGQALTLSVISVPATGGTFSASVPVVSAEGGTLSIAVSLTAVRAPDAPKLVVSPATVRMNAVRGGPNPPSQTVLLSNGGGGSLGALGLSEASPWLTASAPGPSVTLSAATGALPAGTYLATVLFTSANGGNESVAVTLVVAEPNLSLSSASASFAAVEGGAASPPSVLITLLNTGAGNFAALGSVTLGSISGGAWLQANLPGGSDTVTLTTTPGGLGAGTYTGTVPVNSAYGGNVSIDVTLTVAPAPEDPEVVVSSPTVSFFAEEGGGNPDIQWISVSNGGGGGFPALTPLTLGSVAYSGGASGWLTRSIVGEALSLTVATGTIPAGSYQGSFMVTPAIGAAETVTAAFTVAATGGPTALELGASAVNFTAVVGGNDPTQREVAVINKGAGDLGNIDVDVSAITYGPGASGWLADTEHSNSDVTLIPRTGTLAPGTYTAAVPVTSTNGGSKTLAVTFTVEAPRLSLETRSVSFSASVGGGNPADQVVGIFNSGAGVYGNLGTVSVGTIVYAPAGTNWLTTVMGPTGLTVRATTGALPAGVHKATVPVSSSLGGGEVLAVAFTVRRAQDQPDLVVSPSTVRMDGIKGGANPPSQTVIISNAGGGELGTLGVVEASPWLSTSPPGTAVTLSAALGALTAGSYAANVQFTSANGGNESVEVTLVVAEPLLTLSTQSLSFTGLVNGSPPPEQSVTLANTGAGTMGNLGAVTIGTVTYGPGATNWVTVPQSGSAVIGGTFGVRVTPGGIPPGSYTATVPVTSQNGGGQSVTVTLSVVRETDPPKLVLSANTLRFGALVGGSNPEPRSVLASNGGGGTLGQTQLGPTGYGPGGTGWLNPALNGNLIAVSAVSGGLEKGSYTATVPVASSQGGSETLAVTLEVGSPRLTVSPRTVSFGDTVGGSGPVPGKVTLANTGGGTFSSLGEVMLGGTLYGEGGSGWLSASLDGNSLALTAHTGELAARTQAYDAVLPVMSPFGGSDTVTVAFTVTPGASPPRLALSVDSISFDAIVGGADPSAQHVSAFNGGGGNLGALRIREITYLDAPDGWLGGSVDAMTLRFMPSIGGLPGGVHRARVVVESDQGGEVRMEARLKLAQPVLSLSSGSVTFSDTLASPDTLRSKVFLSNTGGGDRSSLGTLRVLPINYTGGGSGWLVTDPVPGATVTSNLVELKAHGGNLSEGTSVGVVRIESQWGGVESVEVTFSARKPDRSFDLPTIELVQPGSGVLVPLPGDSVVATAQSGTTAQIGLRVGVRNGSETRVTLSGLRVSVPSYRAGQQTGWITGAFLNKTTATFSSPAELSVTVNPGGLPAGRYEASLMVSSGRVGLESVEPRTLRVLLVVG